MSDYFVSVRLLWNVAKALNEEDLKEEFEEAPREYAIRIYAYEEGMPVKVMWQRTDWEMYTIKEVHFDYCTIYVSSPPVDVGLMTRITRELLKKLWMKFGVVYRIGGYEALDKREVEEYISQFVEKVKGR
jgi:hypothetical protein